jgi:hypothetical protein
MADVASLRSCHFRNLQDLAKRHADYRKDDTAKSDLTNYACLRMLNDTGIVPVNSGGSLHGLEDPKNRRSIARERNQLLRLRRNRLNGLPRGVTACSG